MKKLHLGISTCPNDTFAFHGLLTGAVSIPGIELEFELADVQELNTRMLAGEFDASKASFHAALRATEEVGVLSAGSALGFGVGPLLLGARAGRPEDLIASEDSIASTGEEAGEPQPALILCPGEHTTAHLLYRLFHPGAGRVEQVVFSDVMPRLEEKTADFGVCIHEGRFTWRERGLHLVEDLGAVWERATSAPLPLGGILARHSLGAPLQRALAQAIAESIDYGHAHREETFASMRAHAQELSDDVIAAHVDLYVNRWTRDLGAEGRLALSALSERAKAAGLLPSGARELDVLG